MSTSDALNKIRAAASSRIGGRRELAANYPNEFEYYMCALELIDSTGSVIDLLVFPVMPKSMSIREPKITNIKKTTTGIVTLSTPNFIPLDLSINGNFGRKLRFLLGTQSVDAAGFAFSTLKNIALTGRSIGSPYKKKEGTVFDQNIKSGYAVCKILEKIIQASTSLDSQGQPHKLLFYNLAFNANYLVEPLSVDFSMSEGENMIWNYSLSMKAIAPADQLNLNGVRNSKAGIPELMNKSMIQKRVNKAIDIVSGQRNILANKLLANTLTLGGERSLSQLFSQLENKTGLTKLQKQVFNFNDARDFGY